MVDLVYCSKCGTVAVRSVVEGVPTRCSVDWIELRFHLWQELELQEDEDGAY